MMYDDVRVRTAIAKKGGDMYLRQPTTEMIKASDARQQLPTILNRVFHRETRVLVEKSGIPVAAIVSAHDLQRLEQLDKQQADDLAFLERMQRKFEGVPVEEVERETDRAIAAIRARNAKTRQ
jgi:prevent-host-death family protein